MGLWKLRKLALRQCGGVNRNGPLMSSIGLYVGRVVFNPVFV